MIITITDEYIAPVENKNSAADAIGAAAAENVELHTILIAFCYFSKYLNELF